MEKSRRRTLVVSVALMWLASAVAGYRPGDIVPMSRMGQYHSSRTVWHDMIGRHCPIFAVNREVLMPLPKPTGFTGADPYKIDIRSDLLGVTAKVIDMPHTYVELHPDIRKQFWDSEHWPKHVLVRYTWEEQSEIDVASGFYVLFGSGLLLSFILSIYVLQSSRDKLARFVKEAVAESSMPTVGVAKVE